MTPSLDTIEELAHSPLNVEAFNPAGKGLDRGLSPTLDLIVDKYSDAADSEAPDEHVTRIKEGKIAKSVFDTYTLCKHLHYQISKV